MSSYRSRCQNSLLTFLQACISDFQTTDTHAEIIKILQDTLTNSPVQRVSISCPPRIGKSSSVIRSLAWASGNSECGLNHFVSTYGLTLSNYHRKTWNDCINSDTFSAVFSKKKAESLTLPLFTSPDSVGTGIAAGSDTIGNAYRGGLIFDDLVKTITREPLPAAVVDWYTTVASTRRQKEWAMINIGTRFGISDFTGLLRTIEGEYHPVDNPEGVCFYNFPALLDNNESFWPESQHMSTRQLLRMRDNPATNENFMVVYQGMPEQTVTKEEPIDIPDYSEIEHGRKIDNFVSIDCSQGIDNPTAVMVLSITETGFWVIESITELWGLKSVSTLKNGLKKLKLPDRGLVEAVGFGTALEYTQVKSQRPKRERLMASLTTLQNNFTKAPGLDVSRFEDQINDFGVHPFDDLADCATQAVIFYHKMKPPELKSIDSGGFKILTSSSGKSIEDLHRLVRSRL
jgi:hypothetical protein